MDQPEKTERTLLKKLTRGNALFLIFILGCGGSFQNGYHITGLSSPSPFIQSFINSTWYDRHKEPPPKLTLTVIWSAVVSMFAVGGFFGALCVKFMTGLLGIKKAIICNSLIALMATGIMLTSKYANSYAMIIIARGLYGFTVGLGTSCHLMYLGEISPKEIRGTVTMTSGIFLSFGKLSGQLFGLSEILGREELWNFVFCVPNFLSLLQLLVLPFFPEGPRYLLIEKNDHEACKKALQNLWGQGEYKEEIDELMAEQAALEVARPQTALELLRDSNVRWQFITMLVIRSCMVFSGMSAISIFSFDIFLEAGISSENIRYITLGLGVTEIFTYIFCGFLIERTGRRPLFWGGFGAMSATLVLITVTLTLKDSDYWVPYITVGLIVLFIIFFAGGPSGAVNPLSLELFTQTSRPAAFVLVGVFRWFVYAILTLIFPFIINNLGSYCFVLFACVCLVGSLCTFFFLPETKGKTLLEISEEFKAITVCGKSFSQEERVETKL